MFKDKRPLIFLLLLAALLRFFRLDYQSFWFDEAFSGLLAQMPQADFWRVLKADVHPPLYYLLLRGWTDVFGSSDWAIRSMSATLAVLSLLAFWSFARSLLDFRGAALGVFFASLSTFQIYYAQESRPYALLLLLTALSLHALVLNIKSLSWQRLFYLAAINALLLYTHYQSFFLLLAEYLCFLGVLLLRRKNMRAKEFWLEALAFCLGQSLTLVFFLPWLGVFWQQLQNISGRYWIAAPTLSDFFGLYIHFLSLRSWPRHSDLLLIASLSVALALLFYVFKSLVLSQKDSLPAEEGSDYKINALYFLSTLAFLPAILCWCSSHVAFSTFLDRTLIFSSLPFYLLLACLILKIKARVLQCLTLGLVVTLLCYRYPGYYNRKHKENWREMAAFMSQSAKQQEPIVCEAPGIELSLLRYWPEAQGRIVSLSQPLDASPLWVIKAMSQLSQKELLKKLGDKGYNCKTAKKVTAIEAIHCVSAMAQAQQPIR